MIQSGILNPQILALLARTRHTNTLVVADRGFPSWRQVECVDLSLTDNIPTVAQVLAALKAQWLFRGTWMATEFRDEATEDALATLNSIVKLTSIQFEPHTEFKLRVPHASGIIRTGDCTPYANIILESA